MTVRDGIQNRVRKRKPGAVFTPADFAGLGTPHAVGMALARLVRDGALQRVGRGLYDVPRHHPLLGPLLPDSQAIARALAGKGRLRLQPSGAYAANLLGLTEQVPLKLVFLTDGASRTVRVGAQQIALRHTTPRHMATAGRVSGLVIQALRHLKQRNVDSAILRKLRRRLTAADRKTLRADAPLAPVWIGRIMQSLAEGAG